MPQYYTTCIIINLSFRKHYNKFYTSISDLNTRVDKGVPYPIIYGLGKLTQLKIYLTRECYLYATKHPNISFNN